MLGEIFYWTFNMSIATSICGAAILLLRKIKKIPRRAVALLWLIPLIRMCVPVGLGGKYGLMSLLSKFTTKTVTVYVAGDSTSFTMMNHIMGANSYFPITYKVDILEDLFAYAAVVWGIVAAALILANVIIYVATVRELRDAEPIGNGMYLSDRVRVPAVYGIIKPRIVIPHEYEDTSLEYILMHERAHVKRLDNLYRAIFLLVACVHWFNPLSWLFLKLLCTDIELACDEAVVSRCSEESRREYAHALVSSAENVSVFASSFGGARIRLRIESVMSYKRLSAVSAIGFAAMLVAIAYILLTNAS